MSKAFSKSKSIMLTFYDIVLKSSAKIHQEYVGDTSLPAMQRCEFSVATPLQNFLFSFAACGMNSAGSTIDFETGLSTRYSL